MRRAFRIETSRQFAKDLRRLEPSVQRRVARTLGLLVVDPYQGKKLTNVEVGQYRIRIGDYRVRYDVEGKQRVIILYRIRHRREIYER